MINYRSWNFDVDRILNPIIPSPPWQYIPYPISWWFGYRKTKPPQTGNLMPIFWAFIGIFCSICIIESVSRHIPSFPEHNVPVIVGSFGAAAVLEFYAIEAPLAQPRNAIVGQLIAAIIGVAVGKLFLLSDDFETIKWVGGAIACASATALMALTKTVHPPAGATALLAVVDPNLIKVGWFLIPVMLLGCGLMLAVALLINNLERTFPVYWWTPEDLKQARPMFLRRRSLESMKKTKEDKVPDPQPSEDSTQVDKEDTENSDLDLEAHDSGETAEEEMRHVADIVIRPGQVVVPEHLYLTQEEMQLLETLSKRL
ncbi:Transmembrane protein [Cladobotryum mycophilum]|uniref:Transmembrane protein n=1 Tax=Cladobotryum mycophilum TaxID=491253 RepID=A0ABR0SA67_9HYPO